MGGSSGGGHTIGGTCRMVMLWGCRQISNRLGRWDEEEKAGDEMMRMMYVPGGVMSVATANALKVKWPVVCQKASCQRLVLLPFVFM